ncbi:MAG TPA: ABC transporter ATP-binding protein [Actinomycetota bacterium]|nr:ABC transporter ATP-binding protein [Actinomycetota bacterium]
MSDPILICNNLSKTFGERTAVDDVSFQIQEGEAYGLLGPNGAGKTTTISMICGLMRKDKGEVVVAGQTIDERSTKSKSGIGYVPQEVALYPDLSGAENLKFWGKLYGLPSEVLKKRVSEVLELVGLTDRSAERVSKYSGGMKRRLNIAAGLLHEPRLLVLDEPTVGVDPQSRNAILENIEKLNAEGMAVLYTSHYMEEVERLCDRVGIIDEGKLIAEGTRRELVEQIGQTDRIEVAAEGDLNKLAKAAKRLKDVEDASVSDTGVQMLAHEGRNMLPKILEMSEKAGVRVSGVEVIEPDLEAVFLHLTGKALRD